MKHVLMGILVLGASFASALLNGAAVPPEKAVSSNQPDRINGVKLDADKCLFQVSTNKDPLSYRPGEKMIFTIRLVNHGPAPSVPYSLKYTRSGDDGKVVNGVIPFKNAPISIETSLNQPGFVRLEAQLVDCNGKKVTRKGSPDHLFVDCGASVQPEKLTGTAEPADFDAFWNSQKARLAAVPVKALEMKKVRSGKNADVFQVKVACAGPAPVTGYLTIPKNAKPKSCSARVSFQAYYFIGGRDVIPADGPENQIVFNINAHGYDLGREPAYYKEFSKKIRTARYGYAFDPDQNKNRDTAYFNGMSLRVMRALQFVKTLPQYNGKALIVSGASQGGLQTLWAAGLDPDVTLAEPVAPWCCDIGGNRNFKRLCGNWRLAYYPALEYYDPIHFAKRIRCRVVIGRAGLGDYICPPSGIAVFYNNLNCPKEIYWYQNTQHGYVPKKTDVFRRKADSTAALYADWGLRLDVDGAAGRIPLKAAPGYESFVKNPTWGTAQERKCRLFIQKKGFKDTETVTLKAGFIPDADGELRLNLNGCYVRRNKTTGQDKAWVDYRKVTAEGTVIRNGDFSLRGKNGTVQDWALAGGVLLPDGGVSAWNCGNVNQTVKVKKGVPVTLTITARKGKLELAPAATAPKRK